MADEKTIKEIEASYEKLNKTNECTSLLKKCLNVEVMNKLKGLKSKHGATLMDVIRSEKQRFLTNLGVQNLDSSIGVCAPDNDCYTLFKDIYDPIIEIYHRGFSKSDRQPATELGVSYIRELKDLDPEKKFILSTRIRGARSLRDYPFNSLMTLQNYRDVESEMRKIFENIKDPDLCGRYYPLDKLTDEQQSQFQKDNILFKCDDRFLLSTNSSHYFPNGRGIFHNEKKTFVAWVNEEDHLRISSMQEGGKVGEVWERMIRGTKAVYAWNKAVFFYDERLGWLTFGPTNLGTTVRASVHIKLPKISSRPNFNKLCDELKLQKRDIGKGGVYDLSNKVRLGITEYQAVRQMYDGVKSLIKLEIAASNEIDDPSSSSSIGGTGYGL